MQLQIQIVLLHTEGEEESIFGGNVLIYENSSIHQKIWMDNSKHIEKLHMRENSSYSQKSIINQQAFFSSLSSSIELNSIS